MHVQTIMGLVCWWSEAIQQISLACLQIENMLYCHNNICIHNIYGLFAFILHPSTRVGVHFLPILTKCLAYIGANEIWNLAAIKKDKILNSNEQILIQIHVLNINPRMLEFLKKVGWLPAVLTVTCICHFTLSQILNESTKISKKN